MPSYIFLLTEKERLNYIRLNTKLSETIHLLKVSNIYYYLKNQNVINKGVFSIK